MTYVMETRDSLERMFNSRSIAVVGASNDPRKFGYMTLDCLIKGGFKGLIFSTVEHCLQCFGIALNPLFLLASGHLLDAADTL